MNDENIKVKMTYSGGIKEDIDDLFKDFLGKQGYKYEFIGSGFNFDTNIRDVEFSIKK